MPLATVAVECPNGPELIKYDRDRPFGPPADGVRPLDDSANAFHFSSALDVLTTEMVYWLPEAPAGPTPSDQNF